MTSTLMSSDASTSAAISSSLLAIARSIELKLAGRLRVIVAIGPSMASSAGSDGGTLVEFSVITIGMAPYSLIPPFKSKNASGDNPFEVCKMAKIDETVPAFEP